MEQMNDPAERMREINEGCGILSGAGVRGSTQDLIPVDVLHRDYRSFGSRANGVAERVIHRGLPVH